MTIELSGKHAEGEGRRRMRQKLCGRGGVATTKGSPGFAHFMFIHESERRCLKTVLLSHAKIAIMKSTESATREAYLSQFLSGGHPILMKRLVRKADSIAKCSIAKGLRNSIVI